MSYFWFSFSKNGKNQGCINVEANTSEIAMKKAIELNIVPKHDDVETYKIDEPEIPINVLMSPEEMRQMEYASVKYKKTKTV